MKNLGLILIVLMITSHFSGAQTAKFSGTWKLDSTKTSFGGVDPKIAAPQKIVVGYKGDSIAIERTFQGLESMKVTLSLKGDKVERISSDGNTLISECLERSDGDRIKIHSHFEIGDGSSFYDRVEDWILSADHHTFTIERITTLPDKIDRVMAVYNKTK